MENGGSLFTKQTLKEAIIVEGTANVTPMPDVSMENADVTGDTRETALKDATKPVRVQHLEILTIKHTTVK